MIHVKNKLKLGLGLALTAALVCSLVLVAAPWGTSEAVADPGDITSYRARLGDRGDSGEVTWDDTTEAAGDYSVKLDVGAADFAASAASYSFRFLPSDPPRMALESGEPKSGVPPAAGFPLSELASASDINVWLNLSVAAPTPYVNLFLYVPGAPSYPLTKTAGECLMSGISQWDEDLGFPQHGWTLYVMEGSQVSPVDGTLDVDTWELYKPDDAWYSGPAGAGGYPGQNLAWWQANYPDGIVLGMMIMNGMWSDQQGPCNVDDASITHTPAGGSAITDTYVVEPQIDRLLPSIALDVKGAVQKFTVNSINPDWVKKWEITPVVNLEASDITYQGGGRGVDSPSWRILGGASGDGTGTHADWIAIRSLSRGDCHIMAKINFNGDTEDDRYIWGEKKWGEISRSELDVNLDEDGVQNTRSIVCELDSEGNIVTEQEWLEETVWANFYWGSIDVIEEYTAGHALVHWWLIEDTTDNQDVIHDLMDALEPGNDGWSACGKYDSGSPPFDIIDTLAAAEHPVDPNDSDVETAWWKDELGDAVGAPAWYTQTETEDDWPGEMRGHTWAELGVLLPDNPENGYLPVDLIIVTLAEYPHDYSGENAVAVQMGKKSFTSLPPLDLKDVQTYVDDVIDPDTGEIDPIRKMFYVFVRDYDGSPAVDEAVEFAIDGPYGLFEELLTGSGDTCGPCSDDDDYTAGISTAKYAVYCTREATEDEIAEFVTEAVFADEDDADDYAIAGVKIVSSHCEDVDVLIYVHDCYGNEEVVITRDVMVTGFCVVCEDEPAIEVGLDSISAELVIAYCYKAGEGTAGWTVYDPLFPDESDLTTLFVGRGYWINVSEACTLDYGEVTYELDAQWNLIGWIGCD